jgi:hypothetical protein
MTMTGIVCIFAVLKKTYYYAHDHRRRKNNLFQMQWRLLNVKTVSVIIRFILPIWTWLTKSHITHNLHMYRTISFGCCNRSVNAINWSRDEILIHCCRLLSCYFKSFKKNKRNRKNFKILKLYLDEKSIVYLIDDLCELSLSVKLKLENKDKNRENATMK